MSTQDLPEIDSTKRLQRLKSKLSDSEYNVNELELLAEALRDERDQIRQLAVEQQQEIESLKAQLVEFQKESENPVAKITDLK